MDSELTTLLDSAKSIPEVFYKVAALYPNELVYAQAHVVSGSDKRAWRSKTFNQVVARVSGLANYLLSIGVKRGDAVAILSQSRPEWMEADLAILAVGGVVVSVYQSLPAEDVGYLLYDSGAQVVFAENDEQLAKLRRLTSEPCPVPATEDRPASSAQIVITKIITFEQVSVDETVITLEQICANGDLDQKAIENRINALNREEIASLVYTSGTTGPPKGVIQTHGNHLANVRQVLRSDLVLSNASLMLFLPLAHSFAKLMGYLGFLTPISLKFPAVPDPKSSRMDVLSITRDIREGSAQIVPIVPRILEKMQEGILLAAHGSKPGAVVLRLGLREAEMQIPSFRSKMMRMLSDQVKGLIRNRLFGSNFKYAISGGAKLSPDIAKFFDSLGIEILQGYGLTETCVATNSNRPGRNRIGTVGPVLDTDIELRIEADDEILFRGPNVTKGYLNRKSATQASWDSEGWFHTGDLGSVDQDGFLTITGRKKELIVTSYGKKVAPERIEQLLKSSPYISQAVLVGEGRAYCVALLVLSPDQISRWAKEHGVVMANSGSSPEVRELIQSEISRFNSSLASFETIKKFAILSCDFTIENGLLTPTFKVKRGLVGARFNDEIDRLYQE